MRNSGLEEAQAGIKIAERNINNLSKNFFLNPNISSDLHIHFISLLYDVFEYFLL